MKYFILLVCIFQFMFGNLDEQKAHVELRAILNGIETSVNEKKYNQLEQFFSKNMKVTTINQEFLTHPSQIEDYFNKWFGKDGYLKDLQIKLTSDEKTKFYSDMYGIVSGYGVEKYLLSDTRFFEMKTRWTASVIYEEDSWKILSLHIGTNFLDNPVMSAIEDTTKYFTIAGIIIGLLVGFIGSFFYLRRKYKSI